MNFQRLSLDDTKKLLESEDCVLVDIRDPASFSSGRIQGSLHITENNVKEFLDDVDKEKPLIVVCYHGNSSQSAAAFFAEQGCKKVYSLDGGFVEWQQKGEDFISD